jgi:hypothetical protein
MIEEVRCLVRARISIYSIAFSYARNGLFHTCCSDPRLVFFSSASAIFAKSRVCWSASASRNAQAIITSTALPMRTKRLPWNAECVPRVSRNGNEPMIEVVAHVAKRINQSKYIFICHKSFALVQANGERKVGVGCPSSCIIAGRRDTRRFRCFRGQ